jgi:hypothetical protein
LAFVIAAFMWSCTYTFHGDVVILTKVGICKQELSDTKAYIISQIKAILSGNAF